MACSGPMASVRRRGGETMLDAGPLRDGHEWTVDDSETREVFTAGQDHAETVWKDLGPPFSGVDHMGWGHEPDAVIAVKSRRCQGTYP